MSKIYEALKKAEQDRERTRLRTYARPAAGSGRPVPTDGTEEDYQKLRASLVSIAVPSGLHTILITAPRHGEGVTTVAIGLATALAQERESRVVLVEGNLRTPCFSTLLPLTTESGLADFAAGRVAPEVLATRVDALNFSVISAGAAPSLPINFEMLDALLTRLRSQFDFIVIDGPPVNQYADASVLATKVDGVILVVEADSTPVVDAETAKRQLDKVGTRILGVVLNRRRSYIPAFLESIL
ncbi:MAG: CpsD/CapB family tyrosine-protein kinase [Candidatus Binatia bacterium]